MPHRLFYNPASFIDEKVKKKSYEDGYYFSVYNSLILTLTFVLTKMLTFDYSIKELIVFFLLVGSTTLLAHYFFSYLLWEFFKFIKKDTSYFAILSLVGYTAFYFVMATAVSVVLTLLPILRLLAPYLGLLLFIRGFGIFVRFLKDYAKLTLTESVLIIFLIVFVISLWVSGVYFPFIYSLIF